VVEKIKKRDNGGFLSVQPSTLTMEVRVLEGESEGYEGGEFWIEREGIWEESGNL